MKTKYLVTNNGTLIPIDKLIAIIRELKNSKLKPLNSNSILDDISLGINGHTLAHIAKELDS